MCQPSLELKLKDVLNDRGTRYTLEKSAGTAFPHVLAQLNQRLLTKLRAYMSSERKMLL